LKIASRALVAAMACMLWVACARGPGPVPGRPEPVKRPSWSKAKAAGAVEKLAEQYRRNPETFMKNRDYVWTGDNWVWPETIGVRARHMNLLEKLFREGDACTREIVLNVILMNLPPEKIRKASGEFLRELVILDTNLKEKRADVPPPSSYEDEVIIEKSEPGD